MNESKQIAVRPSALGAMAAQMNVTPEKLFSTLKDTVFQGASESELVALVVVANQHGLNPFTREIYAFPKKGGGIVPVVGIDGWIRIMNSRPEFDGIEFAFSGDGDDLECAATLHVKGRSHPVKVTEYLSECFRPTEPWKTCPRRMLRHKATIQAARLAFGFTGIHDADDAEMAPAIVTEIETVKPKRSKAEPAQDDVRMDFPKQESATDSLAAALSKSGFGWDDLCVWGQANGTFDPKNADGFQTMDVADAKRLLRVADQVIAKMNEMKGGAK